MPGKAGGEGRGGEGRGGERGFAASAPSHFLVTRTLLTDYNAQRTLVSCKREQTLLTGNQE